MATCGIDGKINLFHLEKKSQIMTIPEIITPNLPSINRIRFSHDSRFLGGAYNDGSV